MCKQIFRDRVRVELRTFVFSNDGQEFAGSIYQRVNDRLESGVNLAWTASNNATRFGLGCVYKVDSSSSLRVSS